MEPGRGVREEHIARPYPVPVQCGTLLDHTHDGAGQIEVPGLIEPRHLRGFTADERHAVGPAAPGYPGDDALQHRDLEARARYIVQERERPRAVDQDVVHTVVDQILAHRVVAAGVEGHEHLGAHAIGAHDEHRVLHVGWDAHHPPEAPDCSERERGPGPGYQRTDPGLGLVRADQVHAGCRVLAPGHPASSARSTMVRSRKARARFSTSPVVRPSKPRTPNCDTAYDPIAAP